MKLPPASRNEPLALKDATVILLDECRMVLPGIQALFGFQLIATFSPGFKSSLSILEQHVHGVALALVGIAIALIMTPAAYHRQAGARHVSDTFITVCTRILLCAMVPLLLGICLDFYLVSRVLWDRPTAIVLAGVLLAVFVGMWFVFPHALMARYERKAPPHD